jgi:hypothetical protein
MYLNKYYLEHLTVKKEDRHCNSLGFDPSFKRFCQDVTEIWPKQMCIVLVCGLQLHFAVCSYDLSGLLNE